MEIKKGLTSTQINPPQTTENIPAGNTTVAKQSSLGVGNVRDSASQPVENLAQAERIGSQTVTPQEEQTVRSFYEKAWNQGDKSALEAHPKIAQQCARQLDKYTEIFPDLKINVNSMERHNEEVWVHWSAEGTRANALEGAQLNANKENVNGLTRMKINDGEIVWAKAAWDDRSLQQRLNSKIIG